MNIDYKKEIESLLKVMIKWKFNNLQRAIRFEDSGDKMMYSYTRGRAEALDDVQAMLKNILNKEDM